MNRFGPEFGDCFECRDMHAYTRRQFPKNKSSTQRSSLCFITRRITSLSPRHKVAGCCLPRESWIAREFADSMSIKLVQCQSNFRVEGRSTSAIFRAFWTFPPPHRTFECPTSKTRKIKIPTSRIERFFSSLSCCLVVLKLNILALAARDRPAPSCEWPLMCLQMVMSKHRFCK